MLEVQATTGGKLILGPGTLYGTIQRLLKTGLIVESAEREDRGVNAERRRYYRITPHGSAAAKAEAERLRTLVQAAYEKALLKRPRTAEEGA